MLNFSRMWHLVWVIGVILKLSTADRVGPVVFGVSPTGDIYTRLGITACNKTGTEWKKIDGSGIKQIDVGEYGIWAVNDSKQILYRDGISKTRPEGTSWLVFVSGELLHVSSGKYGVWGTHSLIWARDGITEANPLGTQWVRATGYLQRLDSGDSGVWGVNLGRNIYYRSGITSASVAGDEWVQVVGALTDITSGKHAVYGVIDTTDTNMYYRQPSDPPGQAWSSKASPTHFKQLSAAGDHMWAVSVSNEVYFLNGLTSANVAGTNWEQVDGTMKEVAVGFVDVLSAASSGMFYKSDIYEGLSSTYNLSPAISRLEPDLCALECGARAECKGFDYSPHSLQCQLLSSNQNLDCAPQSKTGFTHWYKL